jgi:hypothetical protein
MKIQIEKLPTFLPSRRLSIKYGNCHECADIG